MAGSFAHGTSTGQPISLARFTSMRCASMNDSVWNGLRQPSASVLPGSGTTSASDTPITRPKPLQSGHAPIGELNEKRFGFASSNARPQSGHSSFEE